MTEETKLLEVIQAQLHSVVSALRGDELGNPGLVRRVEKLHAALEIERENRHNADAELHRRIDLNDRRISRIGWVGFGIGIGAGVAGGSVGALIIRLATQGPL